MIDYYYYSYSSIPEKIAQCISLLISYIIIILVHTLWKGYQGMAINKRRGLKGLQQNVMIL